VRTVAKKQSPEGLKIPGTTLTVGRKLGSGAEKDVHELKDTESTKLYAIKITKTPTGADKKKETLVQLNAEGMKNETDLLCGPLSVLQGDVVPAVPFQDLSCHYGEDLNGFNFSVVERMEGELLSFLPAMVENAQKSGASKVNLFPIAQKLVSCCDKIQKCGYVNVDLKPENIMLAPTAALNAGMREDSVASGISLIDWGLARPIAPEGKYEYGAGTPAFMALSAHTTTPSPREDVEGVIYVLSRTCPPYPGNCSGRRGDQTDGRHVLAMGPCG